MTKELDWSKWKEFGEILYEAKKSGGVSAEKEIKKIVFPKLVITDKWGIPGTEDRKYVQKFFAPIGRGRDLKSKIKALNNFIKSCSEEKCIAVQSVRVILSKIVVLETLAALCEDSNASTAGFLFEPFLAILLDPKKGEQIPAQGHKGLDDIVAQGEQISLKLIGKQSGTVIKGSVKNLKTHKKPLKYIVAQKDLSGDGFVSIHFFEFYIGQKKGSGVDYWIGDGSMKSDGTQFHISQRALREQNHVGTLSLGSRALVMEVAQRYVDKLGTSLFDVFEHMENLTSQINDYFLSNKKSSGEEAKQSATYLKNTVDEEF